MNSLLTIEELVDNSYRQLMFKILLLIIIVFGLFFALLNYKLDGDMKVATIELICAFFSLVILLNLKELTKTRYYQYLVICYVFIICLLDGYIFSLSDKHSIQLWVLVIPLLSYLLLGKKGGFWITLITITISYLGFYIRFGYPFDVLDKKLVINVLGIFGCTWLVAHIYEKTTFSAQIKLAKNAVTDSLTGLFNRNALSVVFEKYKQNEFSILLMDIDWFKKINDTYGHETGDYVLADFAKLQSDFFIDKGLAFRVGGEEFCVFLPNINKIQTQSLADEFIELVSHRVIDYKQLTLQITFSGGIAYSSGHSTSIHTLMSIADKNLYQAKNNGRNRVI